LSALVEGDFDSWWHDVLQRGLIPKSSFEPLTAQPQLDFNRLATTPTGVAPAAPEARTLEFAFRPDPSINDGYYANNGWLQELPNPLTSLTWDNAAIISPATAARLGLKMENTFRGGGFEVSVVKLSYAGAEIEAPVWILPGQPEDTVTLHLGFGRTNAGIVGNNVGYNAYALRPSWALWQGTGMRVTPTGRTTMLASTQVHFSMEGREPVRVATIDRYQANPEAAFEELVETPGQELSMYPQFPYPNYRWGMAIDNNACVGCNACVVACQSENNVPVVGKEQVLRSREMHWLRIDNYYHGGERDAANPEGPYFEPLMCVHCEVAPCEPVCPVHATVHTADGLSAMVYNRCIGTRYCSNNCPYKVRRFNFFRYQDWETEQFKMMRNPEVTVRSRGVMEKCSYCVQRIQTAKIDASRRGDRVRDGEVITACQAACPTEAIIFGDLNDQNARVTRILAVSKRQYPLLGELNTQPRTRHLGVLRNPNPEIEHPGEHEFGRLKQTAPGEAGR
jgi:molybdopterin-containing oxidoreductase family iron-sulfur binding subunit